MTTMARFLHLMFFIIVVLINGFQTLDAAALPVLTCNVTKIDTSFWYQISGKPNLTGYSSDWEEKKRTVIVDENSKYNKSLVKSLHEDSVELSVCKDFLRYNMKRHEKDGTLSNLNATCEVNCTDLMAKDSGATTLNGTSGQTSTDHTPKRGIVRIVLGIFFLGTIFLLGIRSRKQSVQIIDLMLEEAALCPADPLTVYQLEVLVPQVGYRSVSQNSCSSRTNGLQPSQPLTQSEAEAIKDNLQNEQVSISVDDELTPPSPRSA